MKKFIVIFLYSICFQIIHTQYLCRLFGYMGFSTHQLSFFEMFSTGILILIPLKIYPKNATIEIVYSLFYFFLYIPILITFLNQYNKFEDIIYNSFFMLVGFMIIFMLANKYTFKSFKKRPRKHSLNVNALVIALILTNAILIFTYRDSIAFVNFADVYQHRQEASSMTGGLISYFLSWNTYFLGPLLLINGLIRKSKLYSILGCISILIIYGIISNKIAIFIPIGIIAVFYLLKRKKKSILVALGIIFSTIILLLFSLRNTFYLLAATVLMRTYGMPGALTYQYNEFFKAHPLTYYTHIGIVNFFTNNSYPYKSPLGFIIASYFNGSESNSNANFWATDGIAALGLFGVLVISVIMGIFLIAIKSVENPNNRKVLSLMMVPFSFMVLNVGLFTTLLTGGFIFLLIYYWIYN